MLRIEKITTREEDDIIEGCKKYSKTAQRALYEKYAPVMRAICIRYANDTQEVKDIIQEGFLKVFSCIKQYTKKGSFEGWIKRIIINTAITHYNNNKKHYYHYDIDEVKEKDFNVYDTGEYEADDEQTGSDEMDNENTGFIYKSDFSREELMDVLNKIPEIFRVVFNLHFIEDYQHKEIAEILNIDITTSRTRLLRAKKMIQKELYELSIKKINKVE